MQCCAVGNDSDLGDFIIDHCQKQSRGEPSDVLNSPGLVRLREGLLTGNLRPMCRRCFFADDRLVTTEDLTARLKAFLTQRRPAWTDVDSLDLTRVYAYSEMAVSFTNRCNLSCVYCIQSTQAKTNPYFNMDFPAEYIESTLDFIAGQGISLLRTCVEGEATIHKDWHAVFSAFNKRYPHIALRMTTNLARRYTEEEMELLARYRAIDVSCDTLDPELYAKLRRGGRLDRVLDNMHRIKAKAAELEIPQPIISLHVVVTDVTLPTLDALADYAFANGCIPVLGNYEERTNSVAYREGICKPVTSLSVEEQTRAQKCIARIKAEIERCGYNTRDYIQGGILYNVTQNAKRNLNRFAPYDTNPLHRAFHSRYPRGTPEYHLDIVYDYDNIAYPGVLFKKPGTTLTLRDFEARQVILREVSIYKEGKKSPKYTQSILPGYRKSLAIKDGLFEYTPVFDDDVKTILVEISEYQ